MSPLTPARSSEPAQNCEPDLRNATAHWRAWLKDLAVSVTGAAVGTMLMLLPWTPGWDLNFFSGWTPWWYTVWVNPYFRGAVSGLGALNLCVVGWDLILSVARWWARQRATRSNR